MWDIWKVVRKHRSDPWGEPINVAELNTARRDGMGWISADALRLYFSSDGRKEGEAGAIYVAKRRTRNEPFGSVELLASLDTPLYDGSPSLSEDELEVVFNRGEEYGEYHIYIARRHSIDSPFGPATAIASIGFPADAPCLSPDGLIVAFQSGNGTDVRIWYAVRKSRKEPFGQPATLNAVNSGAGEESPHFSVDGSTFFFASKRQGGGPHAHTWQIPVEALRLDEHRATIVHNRTVAVSAAPFEGMRRQLTAI